MSKAPAFQFYVKDWLSDSQLKMVSHSTKGIWIDLLCFMWDAPERGQVTGTMEQIKRMVGATDTDFTLFIEEAKTLSFCYFSVTDSLLVTVRNRRMYRDAKDQENNRLRQQRHREKQKSNGEVTPPSSSSSPSPKKKRIYKGKQVSPIPPQIEDVISYCKERNNGIDPRKWYDHYEARGWMIGKNKMKDWKAAVRTWENNEFGQGKQSSTDADVEYLDRLMRGEK